MGSNGNSEVSGEERVEDTFNRVDQLSEEWLAAEVEKAREQAATRGRIEGLSPLKRILAERSVVRV